MKIKRMMNVLFILTLFTILGSYLTFGYISRNLPLEMRLDMLWVEVPWMVIPIYTILYSIKNKDNEKAKRNIIVAIVVILFLIPGLVPTNNKIKYNEIHNYEEMLDIKFPMDGILESEITNDVNYRIENMLRLIAYYKNNIDVKKLDKQIKKSDKWQEKRELDEKMNNVLPFLVETNENDELYILIYNNDTKEYNTILKENKKYDLYTAVYYKKYRAIYIYHYQYNNQ